MFMIIRECVTTANLQMISTILSLNGDDDDDKRGASAAHLSLVWPPEQGGSCTLQSSWWQPPTTGGWAQIHRYLLLPCLGRRPCSATGAPTLYLGSSRRAKEASPGEEFGRGATSVPHLFDNYISIIKWAGGVAGGVDYLLPDDLLHPHLMMDKVRCCKSVKLNRSIGER